MSDSSVVTTPSWVNTVNTTSFRILASVCGAVVNITLLMVAVVFFHWEPTAMQLKLLTGIAGVYLTMMGYDVAQFASKRFSDAGYAAAKNPTQPVKTDVPSPTPAADGSAAPAPVPEAGRDTALPKLAGE